MNGTETTGGRHRLAPRRPRPTELARRWRAAHGETHWPVITRQQAREALS